MIKKIFKSRLLKELLSLISVILIFELLILVSDYIFWILGGFGGLLLLLWLWMVKFRLRSKSSYTKYILPTLYIVSSTFFLILIPSAFLAHIFTIFTSIVYFISIRYVLRKKYKGNDISEIYNHKDVIILLTSFLFFSSIYGYLVILYMKPWQILLAVFFFSILLLYVFFKKENFKNRDKWMIMPFAILLIIELSWALIFWPNGFIVKGLIIFILLYLFIGVMKLSIQEKLAIKNVRKYVFVLILVLILALSTTQWFY